ncbi:hypothetical protein T08_14990 [Trichinella sp. T8]|nr:hypothetical protein T08_14990 [Trichinella sp. T8]
MSVGIFDKDICRNKKQGSCPSTRAFGRLFAFAGAKKLRQIGLCIVADADRANSSIPPDNEAEER